MNKQQFINFEEIQATLVKEVPFPYMVIPNFINQDCLASLVDVFPDVGHRGSVPFASASAQPLFQQFINELEGPTLREIIAKKFTIDLQDKPIMTTLRGYTTERDGHIHTDSKDKLITVLLYMNSNWANPEGKLRVLNNKHSLDDYVEEISPLAGSCLIFKVTPNCWHGHKTFIGKRQSLQLNYLKHNTALTKHLNHHRFSDKLKRLFPRVFNRSNY